jgi:hypothetical protein
MQNNKHKYELWCRKLSFYAFTKVNIGKNAPKIKRRKCMNYILCKAIRLTGALYPRFDGKINLKLYKTIIRPILTYASA